VLFDAVDYLAYNVVFENFVGYMLQLMLFSPMRNDFACTATFHFADVIFCDGNIMFIERLDV
jgi:hypothetical protein